MGTVLTWVAAACGLASAALWWISSWRSVGMTRVRMIEDALGDDGDLAFSVDQNVMVYRLGRLSKLNAAAACLAGLSIAMQSVANLL